MGSDRVDPSQLNHCLCVVQHDCVRERMEGLVVHELRCVVANTDKCMMEEGGMALLLGKLKLGNKSI